jgi:hypothetical protein
MLEAAKRQRMYFHFSSPLISKTGVQKAENVFDGCVTGTHSEKVFPSRFSEHSAQE